ncbi:SNF2-related protein [Bacillus spizizenii]|nr:SNF2-related protein [Bacillus spizizenii]MCY8890450.1 SNF2-related protein [Bacillus spizizenii]MEC0841905.1 SNF2-related protein [Bacillus spizizenii]
MIQIEQVDGRHLVSFKGKKEQFNTYINKIMSVEDKDYDFERKCWAFDDEGIRIVERMFQVNNKPKSKPKTDIIQTSAATKTKVVGHESIGKSMKLQPYDYQKEAIKFGVDNKEILIVYPCGAGKTPIGIGLYLEAREHGMVKGPGMIVVKASLKTQWLKEITKFSDLKPAIVRTPKEISSSIQDKIKRRKNRLKKLEENGGSGRDLANLRREIISLQKEAREKFQKQFEGVDLFVLNYETLRDTQVRSQLHKTKLEFIMADEVHYIKNRESKRSKALYEFGDVPYKIGATATPVGKNPEDLYGIFRFVKPELFPSWSKFSRSYIKYAGYGKIAGFRNLNKLRDQISPSIIVKSKEDISDQLPSLMVMQRYCDLEPEQLEMHNSILEQLDELKKEERAIRSKFETEIEARGNPDLMRVESMILAHQTFAQQLANSEELLKMSESELSKKFITGSKSNKLELLVGLVEEILGSEEKVVIFSRFKKMQDIIEKRFAKEFPNAKLAYVNGQLDDKTRYKEVYDKFRDQEDYKILLCTDAGAEGLNLSKCKYLIEFDLAESYAIQTQRHGRVERADSVHDTVFVYQLIANDSWDEVAAKIIEKKEGYDAELIRASGD